MSAFKQLDAACVAAIVPDDPVTFGFGGIDYTGTSGPRDLMKSLTEGGNHADQEFEILVPIAAFGSAARPAENQVITVCVDAFGVPCSSDESGTRVNARVKKITPAGGGITYMLRTDTRG